jgi:hypothetical protein
LTRPCQERFELAKHAVHLCGIQLLDAASTANAVQENDSFFPLDASFGRDLFPLANCLALQILEDRLIEVR